MYKTTTVAAIIVAAGVICVGMSLLSRAEAQQTPKPATAPHDHDHDDHDHGEAKGSSPKKPAAGDCCAKDHKTDGDKDDHAGHDHGEPDGHGTLVQLSSDERSRFGIEVTTAASGSLASRIRLPGEIVLNADRVAHIVPRAPGIVREVLANVADELRAGDIMAWFESAELGEAKVDYLAKWSEMGCCTVDLARAQAVHDNTLGLLSLLKTTPTLEALRDFSGGNMGENRSTLVSAYAELRFAESAYQRERPLFEKKIATERDYQAAESAYKKADAMYVATIDNVAFNASRNLLEAKRNVQLREIELKGGAGRLFVMGLSADEITALHSIANPTSGGQKAAPVHKCTDPNCKGCKQGKPQTGTADSKETHIGEEKLGWYPIRAPFDGTVIEKHLTLGEKHNDESVAFTMADLSSVWVNIAVYQKDIPYVNEGMTVSFSSSAGMLPTRSTIAYVSPVVDPQTRTALARVVLPNADRKLRPGLFVNAEIALNGQNGPIVIPKLAVQRMGDEPVVFLDTNNGFKSQPVVLGRADGSNVEVLAGLSTGQRFATKGAFQLKAKIVTSGLDPHAGHGH